MKVKQFPKVTVVTVCLNVADLLEETMNSVFNQGYENMEYIVIDGGSTDGTLDLIKQHAGEISHWVSEPDHGIYDAMNKGIAASTGEWIIFMNAGDTFVDADVVSRVFSNNHADADVVYGDCCKSIDGQDVVVKPHPPRNSHRMNFCHQCAFTRTAWLKLTPFDMRYKLSADFKSFKLIGLAGGVFEYVPMTIAKFDTHGASNTSRAKGLKENIEIIQEVDSFTQQLRLLPRIYFTYLMVKLRTKK